MSVIGTVDSLWRYPVKSMGGEELDAAFVGFSGLYGDRLFAFKSSASPEGLPYLTGREENEMLLFRPRFRDPTKAVKPPNLAAAQAIAPGITPLSGAPADLAVDVETPSGQTLAVEDPALIRMLAEGLGDEQVLTLLRSDRAMTDCRPVSLISIQTANQLGDEIGTPIDKRRFRANVYMNLEDASGFTEDALVGQQLRIGSTLTILVLERDPRCAMITLDPDSARPSPEILQKVARVHDGMAGIYAAVLVEGMVQAGDEIERLT